jgi:ribonuclease I
MPSHRVRRGALSAAIAFSFVFVFVIVALAQDRRQNAPGAFNFYVLALSWSPSFCESAKERAPNGWPDPQCNGGPSPSSCMGCRRNTNRASRPIARCRRNGSTAPPSRTRST